MRHFRNAVIFLVTVAVLSVAGVGISLALDAGQTDPSYEGSSFNDVWGRIVKTRYTALPQPQKVSLFKMGILGGKFLRYARRTLTSQQDLVPRFDKLIRPNGICLAGRWTVERETQYTGLFSSGSEALIIARASVGLKDTKRGEYRSFGIAGKLFPTSDTVSVVKTANFFAIDDNSGNSNRDYVQAPMTNEPAVTKNLNLLKHLPLLLSIKRWQGKADPNGHEGIRQLYPIASAGARGKVVSPKYILVQAAPRELVAPENHELDFRDELDMRNFPEGLKFEVRVGETKHELFSSAPLAKIVFTESAASDACDHELHFAHPPFVP